MRSETDNALYTMTAVRMSVSVQSCGRMTSKLKVDCRQNSRAIGYADAYH